jgi:DNA-binding NarL/FixJ family response regulator
MPNRHQKSFVDSVTLVLYSAAAGAAEALATALEELGFRIAGFTDDVAEAVSLMERRAFDVAVVSAVGDQYAHRVAQQAHRHRARVVCLTGGATAGELPDGCEADAVLAADADPALLLACILQVAGYAWGS